MSQISCGEVFAGDPLAEDGFDLVECVAQGTRAVGDFSFRRDVSQVGTHQAGVGAGEEEADADAEIGHSVAMGVGLADDQAMQAETAQLVRHLARGCVAGISAQQRSEVLPQVAIGEPLGQQTKTEQGTEQRKHGWIAPG